eukprot:2914740-Pyramimonas_sp.AAC.1
MLPGAIPRSAQPGHTRSHNLRARPAFLKNFCASSTPVILRGQAPLPVITSTHRLHIEWSGEILLRASADRQGSVPISCAQFMRLVHLPRSCR